MRGTGRGGAAARRAGPLAGPAPRPRRAAQAAEDAAVAPLLGELERAWLQRDVAGVLALFAPDGVLVF